MPGVFPPAAAAETSFNRQWSFNFQNAPWVTVLRTFAKEAGFSLQMVADPEGDFTYFDENLYSQSEVLDLFNDHLMSTGRIIVRDGRRLTLTNATADIPGNLIPFVPIQMVDSLGRNELASVAIPLRNTDPTQALEEIRQLQSPLGQVKALTNSGRVIVTDTGSYLRRMRDLLLGSGVAAGDGQAYVYQLRHAQAEDVAKAITDFLSSNGGGGISADGSPMGGGSSDSSQRVVAEKTTNSLLVRGTTEEMGTIQRIIEELDRAPREVLVQALLVEVELGNTNELGVELGFQDSVLFDRSVVDKLVTVSQTTTAPNGTQTTNQSIISQTSAPGFNFNNQPLGNNTAASPSRIAAQSLSNFGVGRVNGDLGFGGLVLSAGSESVNVLLRALDAHFNIDVLSRPQVRAVENHEAFIQIGQQVPVVDGVAITPVGSANPVIRQDQAGIILKVTPRISPDGRVQLDVNAEKSAFNLAPGTGVPIFTDATNGNVIEAPIKDITTADTTVSIQSGQTIVLGGMITNDQTVVVRKVPWLGDIPIIGRLFRYDLNRHKRKELLVFLTPTVLESDGHAEYLKGREAELIHMPAEAFSFGDNLTGTYHGGLDSHVIPLGQTGRTGRQEPAEGTESQPGEKLFPESGSDVRPASNSSGRSNASPAIPAAGHSGSIRQASGSGAHRRASFQNGNTDDTSGRVQPASQINASEEPAKKKSLWSRSPNFRGFGRNQKAAEETPPPIPRRQAVESSRPLSPSSQTQFPQPQLSPELLQYQQSRTAGQRR
jgi:type II secretory pathway component GspD/PulD (secretin)